MSIIRIGLSETKNFAEGWDAIFGKKKAGKTKQPEGQAEKSKTTKKKSGKRKK